MKHLLSLVWLSFALHALVLALLLRMPQPAVQSAGNAAVDTIAMVEIQSNHRNENIGVGRATRAIPAQNNQRKTKAPSQIKPNNHSRGKRDSVRRNNDDAEPSVDSGDATHAATQTKGAPGGNAVLSQIRQRIARARYYPRLARQQGLEGRPVVQFRIAPNGGIASISVTTSSGQPILDEAARTTVQRAAPLPYYEGPITLPIRFSLR